MRETAATRHHCLGCGETTERAEQEFCGIKGADETITAAVCSPPCADQVLRFAARRSAQAQTATAGYLVAGLGLLTCPLFWLSGRELGRVLLVLALLGAATTRLAYPDVIPLWLGRRLGIARTKMWMQWLGVAIGLVAVGLALAFLFA